MCELSLSIPGTPTEFQPHTCETDMDMREQTYRQARTNVYRHCYTSAPRNRHITSCDRTPLLNMFLTTQQQSRLLYCWQTVVFIVDCLATVFPTVHRRNILSTFCKICVDYCADTSHNTNTLLVTVLPAKCSIYHTSGKKTSGEWQWTATGQPFNYTSWAPPELNGNGNFCFIWNIPPGWKTWDDRPDTEACFICEYRR